ncbi:MAG: heparinase II/III family protein [Pirellulales bacterium]|nr:heparinase II/III family protein [Pirellulales bacterium]
MIRFASLLWRAALAASVAGLVFFLSLDDARPALAQMSIGSLTGVLPPETKDTVSVILGNDLDDFRAVWLSPLNATQQFWRDTVNGRANQTPSGVVPTTYSQAATDSSIAQSAGLRYAMTGNVADLNKAVGALLLMDVPGGTTITRPEVVTSYLSAYDFIRLAPLADLPQATRDAIRTKLALTTQSLASGFTNSNAKGKIGATRALAGVLLRSQTLLNQGLGDLQVHFNYSTTDDGWYTDGQGHYLNYIMRHVSLFTRAYEQASGVDLYPNFQPLIDMSIALRKPDGTTPNVSNGLNYGVGVNLFSQSTNPDTAAQTLWYLNSLPPNPFANTNLQLNDYSYSSFFALTDFTNVAPHQPTTSPTFLAMGQSHVSVFRQNWGPTSDYLLLSAGIDSPHGAATSTHGPIKVAAFHSHNDTGEILVSSRGHYILVAPGYARTDISNTPAGFDSQHGDWHNVVLVDGQAGDPVVPAFFDPENGDGGRTMRPEDFTHTNRLDSTEHGGFVGVSDFSSLGMTYRGTDVTRSIAFPGEEYFVVFDRMRSDDDHWYGFNLVGRGTQTVLTDSPQMMQVAWEHGGQQAIEHLISTHDMVLDLSSIYMHDEFDQFEETQRMTASMYASDAAFLSVIETAEAGAPSRFELTRLTSSDEYLGLRVQDAAAGWTDTILAQWTEIQRTVGPLTSDAPYAYVREIDGELSGSLIVEGTSLRHHGDRVLEASHPVTLSLLFEQDAIYGTLAEDGLFAGTELQLFDINIVSATLNGIPLSFTNQTGYAQLVLEQGGELVLSVIAVPEPSTAILLSLGGIGLLGFARRYRRLRQF